MINLFSKYSCVILALTVFYSMSSYSMDVQGSCAKRSDQYDNEIVNIACDYYSKKIDDNKKVLLLDAILMRSCKNTEMEINLGQRISIKFNEVLKKKIPCN